MIVVAFNMPESYHLYKCRCPGAGVSPVQVLLPVHLRGDRLDAGERRPGGALQLRGVLGVLQPHHRGHLPRAGTLVLAQTRLAAQTRSESEAGDSSVVMMITPQGTLTMLEVEWFIYVGLCVPSWALG